MKKGFLGSIGLAVIIVAGKVYGKSTCRLRGGTI